MITSRLVVALDVPTLVEALTLVDQLAGLPIAYKVGLELFCAAGPAAVGALRQRGLEVMLDLKLHDIPETVRRAAHSAAATGASWLTAHTAGGAAMLRAAVAGAGAAQVLGVTVLTSLERADLAAVGTHTATVEALVLERAALAQEAGCAGVVASPKEAAQLRVRLGPSFLIVTPGVRPAGVPGSDDQQRTAAAATAIAAGATAVVVGRPVRDAASPRAAVLELLKELGG